MNNSKNFENKDKIGDNSTSNLHNIKEEANYNEIILRSNLNYNSKNEITKFIE